MTLRQIFQDAIGNHHCRRDSQSNVKFRKRQAQAGFQAERPGDSWNVPGEKGVPFGNHNADAPQKTQQLAGGFAAQRKPNAADKEENGHQANGISQIDNPRQFLHASASAILGQQHGQQTEDKQSG